MRKKFTPRPYQEIATDLCIKIPRVAIWAGMGMGKCAIVLSALDKLSLVEPVYPALIVATLRIAKSAWTSEQEKWDEFSHIKIQPLIADSKEERLSLLHKKADIYTINYENIPWLVSHFGDKWPFKTVIADESTKLKGFRKTQGTQRSHALSQVAWSKVRRWINLSGTPSPNGLKDLWGQSWFQDQGQRLGMSYTAFEQRWFGYQRIKDAVSHKMEIKPVIFPYAQEHIQEKLSDICISINSADWFDLKEPIVTEVPVELPVQSRKLYKEMEKEFYIEIEREGIEAFNAASKMNKLQQLANGAVYLNKEDADDRSPKEWKEVHDVKIKALEDIVEEAAGMPVLVSYTFRSDLSRLRDAFPHGRILDKQTQTIKDWNSGKIPLLFAHPASAGHGISLQDGSNILAYFSSSWNLEEDMQILERIGPVRQMQSGYDRNVFIYRIVARNTIDELILKRLKTKQSVQDILLESMKYKKVT